MRCEITPHLVIEVQSVTLDYRSGNWSVDYMRRAWGMEKQDHYVFDRHSLGGQGGSPGQVVQALIDQLREQLAKGRQP